MDKEAQFVFCVIQNLPQYLNLTVYSINLSAAEITKCTNLLVIGLFILEHTDGFKIKSNVLLMFFYNVVNVSAFAPF